MACACICSAWGCKMGEVVPIKNRPRLRLVDEPGVQAAWDAYVSAWRDQQANPQNILYGIRAGKAWGRWLRLFEAMDK